MAMIPTYKDYSEKERYFTVIHIDSKKDFDAYFEKFKEKKNSIWRGLNESKYKLYTSLQRFWIENDLKDDINEVIKYIDHCSKFSLTWNNNFLEKYFEENNIGKLQLFATLSFLRHHGNPSPLMDWTRNPSVALYFASKYSIVKPSNIAIENRFSLYEFTQEHPYYQHDYKELAEKFWRSNEDKLRAQNNKSKIDDPNFLKNFIQKDIGSQEMLFFEARFKNGAIVYKIEDKLNDEIKLFVKNNYNITNQEGLFLTNFCPAEPLELTIEKRAIDLANGKHSYSQIKNTIKEKQVKNQIAYEIHKNLAEYVLYKIENEGITEKFIYPNPNQLALDCLKDYLRS